jgi:hypothetical protein
VLIRETSGVHSFICAFDLPCAERTGIHIYVLCHVNIKVSTSIFAGHAVLKKPRFVNDRYRCVFTYSPALVLWRRSYSWIY